MKQHVVLKVSRAQLYNAMLDVALASIKTDAQMKLDRAHLPDGFTYQRKVIVNEKKKRSVPVTVTINHRQDEYFCTTYDSVAETSYIAYTLTPYEDNLTGVDVEQKHKSKKFLVKLINGVRLLFDFGSRRQAVEIGLLELEDMILNKKQDLKTVKKHKKNKS
ncbi:MAG: DUF3284 domain-containing protein [Erysipelotrichaceae bacterium]|jgi:hypothetical protein|nr:DUF3284 domain-containing protein [Erysipelotrichaceae bacterium]